MALILDKAQNKRLGGVQPAAIKVPTTAREAVGKLFMQRLI
jgi:hypothetical protein